MRRFHKEIGADACYSIPAKKCTDFFCELRTSVSGSRPFSGSTHLAHRGHAIHGRAVATSEFSLDAFSLAGIDHVVQKDAYIHNCITCLPSIEIIDGEGDQHPDPDGRELPVAKTEAVILIRAGRKFSVPSQLLSQLGAVLSLCYLRLKLSKVRGRR